MITEKNTLKSELIYSDDKAKRYSLYLEWQKQGKRATVSAFFVHISSVSNVKCAGSYKTKHNYVLKGLIKCGVCGKLMTGNSKNGYTYYTCPNHRTMALRPPETRYIKGLEISRNSCENRTERMGGTLRIHKKSRKCLDKNLQSQYLSQTMFELREIVQ